jgi:hypothetical protein
MLPQEPLASFFVNECGKHSLFRGSPGVQLDRKRTLINASLKRWRIPQILAPTNTCYTVSATRESSLFWVKRLGACPQIWQFNKTKEPGKGSQPSSRLVLG